MIYSFLPTVFRLLALNPNRAIDDAVARALPSLDDSTQEAACQLLLRRAHHASLVQVVADFRGYGDHLKKLLAGSADSLRPILVELIHSTRTGHSLAAVDLVAASGKPQCVDLLGEGLFAHDRQTRELAARGLRRAVEMRLAAGFTAASANSGTVSTSIKAGKLQESPDAMMTQALAAAVRRWESHEMMPALEAAMWMSDRLHAVFREKLSEPRTTITRAVTLRLQVADDARYAGFMVRALGLPALKGAAARGIGAAESTDLRKAIVQHAWLLADPNVAQGAKALRDVQWLTHYFEPNGAAESLTLQALGWLKACGDAPDQRMERLRGVLDGTEHDARRDALWQLAGEGGEKSVSILSAVAERRGDPLARVAARAVRRHRRMANTTPAFTIRSQSPCDPPSGRAWCEEYWAQADLANGQARGEAPAPPPRNDWLVFLRAKLASGQPADRSRALTLIQRDGLLAALHEQVMRLAHDADSIVRAKAVQMLPQAPSAAAGRVAKLATLDSDPRVQANAVEALDRMDVGDRAGATLPKLESSNNRVRANAVKSLLRLELAQAAEALLAMLEDASTAHRLSGIWVIEQLELRSLTERLQDLCDHDPALAVRRKCAGVLRKFAAGARTASTTIDVSTQGRSGG